MCGIVGVINHKKSGLSAVDRDVFKRLLFLDVERGPDSTGIFVIQNNGVATLLKKAVPSFDFMRDKEFDEVVSKAYANGTFLVGHNRKATKGAIKDENAHPFAEGNIVLVHNGSLWNHKSVADVDVDSKAIAIALNQHDNDVTQAFNKLQGAYACVWYDNLTSSLNFFRNKDRPLNFYKAENATYFASERIMLYYALAKEGIKWEPEKCVELEVHKHVSFKLEKYGGAKSPTQTDVEIKESFSGATTHSVVTTTATSGKSTSEAAPSNGHKISLNARKKLRGQFQNFLNKHPVGSSVGFIPTDILPSKDHFVVIGSIANAPEFILGMTTLVDLTEDQLCELCDVNNVALPAKITSFTCKHKSMEFQLNIEISPQIINAFKAVPVGKAH